MFFALGPDWFLLFLQEHLHSSTVLRGLTLLACFLSTPVLLTKFREGLTSRSLLQRLQGESPIFLGTAEPLVFHWFLWVTFCTQSRSVCYMG